MVDAPEGLIMGVQQTEEKRLQATTAVCEYLEKTLSAHDAARHGESTYKVKNEDTLDFGRSSRRDKTESGKDDRYVAC